MGGEPLGELGERRRRLFERHPYKIVTGVAALLGVVAGFTLDRWAHSTLQEYPISTNVAATVVGVSIPLFLGALFFNRLEAYEKERRRQWESHLEGAKRLVDVLADRLTPSIRRALARLDAIPLPNREELAEGTDRLAEMKERYDRAEFGDLELAELRTMIPGLDDLCLLPEELADARRTIDEVNESLSALEGLGDSDIRTAAAKVRDQVERFHHVLSPRVLREQQVRRLPRERVGTWNGSWVALPSGGGFAVPIDVLQQFPVAAQQLDRLVTSLTDLEAAAIRALRETT